MSDIRLSKDMIGNKVRCVNKIDIHHPEQGAIGTIVAYDEHDAICNYKVQWPKGSTVGNDRWWAMNKCIELVKDDVTTSQKTTDMTNEEIWEMLKPKMEKNKLEPMGTCTKWNGCAPEYFYTYSEDDVHNAIAIAYRSGYERAMKSRPFKFGEKKKKGGHWEPVDPENLPKEGTRVRYSRHIDDIGAEPFSDWSKIQIGEETVVMYAGNEFGVKDIHDIYCNSNFIYSAYHPERFDMWVEDDE